MIEALLQPIVLQIYIGVTGPAAFLLVTRTKRFVALGYVFGLVGQPIWLYVTYTAGTYGFFVNALVWTAIWGQGVWETAVLPALKRRFHVDPTR